MIHKSLAFLLMVFVFVLVGDGQTPAPRAKADVQAFSLFLDGDGSYLGVQTEEITKDNFAKYGLREVRGVAVEKVMEGSPAEKAGLQIGDVIVRFNNEEITSVRKLTRLLGEVAPDHQAKLTVLRNGTEREITATLAKRPAPKFEEGSFRNLPQIGRSVPWPPSAEMPPLPPVQSIPSTPGAPEPFSFRFGSSRKIGVGVTALTKQLSEHFGVSNGLLINEVRADSPAYKAGLKAGDIIIEVDGKEVKGEIDLITAIAEKKDGDVTLTIVRDRNRQTVRVTPEEVTIGTDSLYVLPQPPETDGSGSFSWGRPSFPKLFPNGLFPAMQFPSRIH